MRKIRELQRPDSPPEPDRLGTYETISRAYHRMSEIGPPAPSISCSIAQEIPLSQLHTRFLYHRAMSNHNTINIYGETPLLGMAHAFEQQLKMDDIDSLSTEERLDLRVDREMTERDA